MNRLFKSAVNYLVLIIAAAPLGACSVPDKNTDPAKNNPQAYRQDMKDCALAYPETSDGVYLKRRVGCMELKGWQ